MSQFDLKHALVIIQDGTPTTPKRLFVHVGDGTLNYTERRPIQYMRDRGLLDTTREGDEEPVDVRVDATWDFITGDSDITIEDALKQRNQAASWVTSDTGDPCAPYAVDLLVNYRPPCPTIKAESIILADFRYEELAHDAKAGTINTTGKCNVKQAEPIRHHESSTM